MRHEALSNRAVVRGHRFLVVAAAVRASARQEIRDELRLGPRCSCGSSKRGSQQLLTATRLLSGDCALKTAAATADQATYEPRVWHPRLRGDTEKTGKSLTLPAGEPAQVAFVVSLKTEWRIPRRPIDPYRER